MGRLGVFRRRPLITYAWAISDSSDDRTLHSLPVAEVAKERVEQ